MNIRVPEDAADDLENLKARIAIDDGAAAERVIEQIRSAAMGEGGRLSGATAVLPRPTRVASCHIGCSARYLVE